MNIGAGGGPQAGGEKKKDPDPKNKDSDQKNDAKSVAPDVPVGEKANVVKPEQLGAAAEEIREGPTKKARTE